MPSYTKANLLERIQNGRLELSHQGLTEIPPAVLELGDQLTVLRLWGNQITTIPDSLGQLSQLSTLDLWNNQIATIPDSLAQLSQLNFLDLGNNQLTTIPDSLAQLSKLTHLSLGNNQITTIPDSLAQLSQLTHLYLRSNHLTTVPDSLAGLTQLTHLYLDDNQLTALPGFFRRLTKLTRLFLHGNPQLGLPAEILGPTWVEVVQEQKTPAAPHAILDYYFRTQAASRPLNEAKLILVGRGGAGKTSLVNRLVRDEFDPKSPETQGVQITSWQVRLDGEAIRVNIWDFAGQEITHATHQFFLTQRSLYLLVLTGRDELQDEDADYWLRLIQTFGAGSPVIIVLNKIDEHSFHLNNRGLAETYAGLSFVRTDCNTGTGIDELRHMIATRIAGIPEVRDRFPNEWFAIKDQLSAMTDSYLSYERYRRLCEATGEKDRKNQDRLSRFLHDLGIALNYPVASLRDTSVLKPQWVTIGVYTLLRAEKLSERRGPVSVGEIGLSVRTDATLRTMLSRRRWAVPGAPIVGT